MHMVPTAPMTPVTGMSPDSPTVLPAFDRSSLSQVCTPVRLMQDPEITPALLPAHEQHSSLQPQRFDVVLKVTIALSSLRSRTPVGHENEPHLTPGSDQLQNADIPAALAGR